MTVADRSNKNVVVGVQSAQGTICAVDLATAETIRNIKATHNEEYENYKSSEIRPDKQVGDVNLGPKDCPGSMNNELSPSTYETFMAALLRKAWASGSSDAANTGVASDAAGTFTRDDVDGDWIEDGFKIGDVVRQTGWTTTATANNSHNFLITGLTSTVMTVAPVDGVAVVTKVKGDSITTTVVGKKLWIPATSHTEDWLTIEHNYSDLDESEVFWDQVVSQMAIKIPASGIPTIDFTFLGLNMTPVSGASAPYFTAALGITETEVVHSGKALIYVNGTSQTLATGIDISITGGHSVMQPVVGSNVKPGIHFGKIEATGNVSLFFDSITLRDLFRAGTEVSIYGVIPVSDDADAAFVAFTMHVCKLTGASKEGDTEVIQTFPFQAKFNSAGDDGSTCTVNTLATTISFQDSEIS